MSEFIDQLYPSNEQLELKPQDLARKMTAKYFDETTNLKEGAYKRNTLAVSVEDLEAITMLLSRHEKSIEQEGPEAVLLGKKTAARLGILVHQNQALPEAMSQYLYRVGQVVTPKKET